MLSGHVVRIGPNQFSISDMEVAREVYGPRTLFEKVSLCKYFFPRWGLSHRHTVRLLCFLYQPWRKNAGIDAEQQDAQRLTPEVSTLIFHVTGFEDGISN
jgi:hypothetical protein